MGKVWSVIQRKANRFNVESRAHKVISQDKPTPAPKYRSTIQELETIKSDYPHILEEQSRRDSKLDDRLKQVFVRSYDPIVEEPTSSSSHSLPQDRRSFEETEFGYTEPVMIPQGRVTLKQAIKFITDHQTNPNTWTPEAIAKEYSITQDKIEKILLYYQTFQVHIPEDTSKKTSKKSYIETKETHKPQEMLESKEETLEHQEQK
ncbi:hypothetical protein Cfor_06140 [Coptotermes formosanus]|uniref:NADH dehydrogenase [ubiquinone] 1 alpha subcomplex assembly factor 4 n=1 Tax=Coptotermes formosanus TaxID=36987 RepID=A0A6L2PHM6_COPFO|nr:hypothetical protein Cfor_06140 [Coptotermes formosanus]